MDVSEFKKIFDIVSDLVSVVGVDGYFRYLNPVWEETLGYSLQELLSRPLIEFVHPDDRESTLREIAKQINGNKTSGFENRYRCKNGSYKSLEWRATAAERNNLFAIARDVTERKRMEKALIQAEARHRVLVDTIPDLIWLKDQNGVYLSCNRTFERFFGAKESEIIGKTDYDFVDKDLASFFRKNDQKAMEAGQPSINEEELTFAENGYHGLFETIKTPMYDTDASLIGVLGISRDISERKKAEIALHENEQRYKSAQRMGKVGNWEYDILQERFWGSDEAKRIYGFAPESKNFTTNEVENCIPERERVHQALIDLIDNNKPYNIEFEIRPITGPPNKTLRSIAEVVRDENGAPNKVVGVIQDITQHKIAEREKIELERQLKQAQKMEAIGTLAGGIAHDFNNILGAILGYAEMARDDCSSKSLIAKDLDQVIQASHRAKDLVKQILTFSHQEEIQKIPLQLASIVKEATKLLRSTLPTTITILQNIDPDINLILADPTQIHQILINVTTNAFHAMEDTGGTLTISLKNTALSQQDLISFPHCQPGHYVKLAIADTGKGVAPEIRERIFDPYFTTKETGKGTGLGLSIVHGIVKSYGGFITCHSRIGKGTDFNILFPALEEKIVSGTQPIETISTGTERILLIDDESMLAEMAGEMLSRLGYSVTVRTNSLEALNTFRNQPDAFDLVITDQTMPGMTGMDLSRRILQIRPDMIIILCTGFSTLISEEKAIALGIKGFAYKPLTKKGLANLIRQLLDDNS